MVVAPRCTSEWPASDRMASDPDRSPTAALAMVSAADAAIDERAAFSFTSCMGRLGACVNGAGGRGQCGHALRLWDDCVSASRAPAFPGFPPWTLIWPLAC